MNFTKAIKTAAIATAATVVAIAILSLYPKDKRNQEIERARKSVTERRTQIEKQKAEIEAELKELKVVKQAEETLSNLHEPEPLPELTIIPNPWELKSKLVSVTIETQLPLVPQPQLCLPPLKSTPPVPVTTKKEKRKAIPKPPKVTPIVLPAPLSIPPTNYDKLGIRELKKLASGKIKNYGKMKKSELITALNASS